MKELQRQLNMDIHGAARAGADEELQRVSGVPRCAPSCDRCCSQIVDSGADVNQPDKLKRTALHMAVCLYHSPLLYMVVCLYHSPLLLLLLMVVYMYVPLAAAAILHCHGGIYIPLATPNWSSRIV